MAGNGTAATSPESLETTFRQLSDHLLSPHAVLRDGFYANVNTTGFGVAALGSYLTWWSRATASKRTFGDTRQVHTEALTHGTAAIDIEFHGPLSHALLLCRTADMLGENLTTLIISDPAIRAQYIEAEENRPHDRLAVRLTESNHTHPNILTHEITDLPDLQEVLAALP